MRYYQWTGPDGRRVGVADGDAVYDLTAADADLRSVGALLRAASITDRSIDAVASRRLDDADSLPEVPDDRLVPVDVDEVWAAGVTYEISEQAREDESDTPETYLDVYDAERPEIFFKATPSRLVGPGDSVGVRGDSTWDVPEPELGVVLHRDRIAGYTVGNDVSSRSIEGENPLYLPQAKVYGRCCAIGPCLSTDVEDPHDLTMSMTIERDGEAVYRGDTSTAEMVRTCEELVSWFARHNEPPEFSVLLTGTSLVPEDDFTLRPGDEVRIDIEDVGTLTNGVVAV